MAEFIVKSSVLDKFINGIICRGILTLTGDGKTVSKGNLFEDFLLNVGKDGVSCRGRDTKSCKVWGIHLLKPSDENTPNGVEIVEEGEIPVTKIDDFLTAMKRASSGYKDVNLSVKYPTEENKILISVAGKSTGFSFPTGGKGKIASTIDLDDKQKGGFQSHRYNKDIGNVVAISGNSGREYFWTYKVIVLPSEISEVTKDVGDFVKNKVVVMKILEDRVMFNMGKGNSLKKGSRQVDGIHRQIFDPETKEWQVDDDAKEIVSAYYHGFYAVLQNLSEKDNLVEMYFWDLGKDAKVGWVCWVRRVCNNMVFNYLIPQDKTKV